MNDGEPTLNEMIDALHYGDPNMDDSSRNDFVTLSHHGVKRNEPTKEDAILFQGSENPLFPEDFWVPRSVIFDFGDDFVDVAEWWAVANGWV